MLLCDKTVVSCVDLACQPKALDIPITCFLQSLLLALEVLIIIPEQFLNKLLCKEGNTLQVVFLNDKLVQKALHEFLFY